MVRIHYRPPPESAPRYRRRGRGEGTIKLRFAEEIILLLLDDESGEFVPTPAWARQCALAGAVLMDLALENRIDTDLRKLVVVDATPTGDDLLDPVLAVLSEENEVHDARFWVERVAEEQSGRIQEQALTRLVNHRILESEGGRLLWVFRARRYPTIDGKAEREVKLRIMQVLFSDDIPSPRDIVIICLADACGIFDRIMSQAEVERARARIDVVRRMDLIGQAVSRAVRDIETSIAATAISPF